MKYLNNVNDLEKVNWYRDFHVFDSLDFMCHYANDDEYHRFHQFSYHPNPVTLEVYNRVVSERRKVNVSTLS